MYYSRLHTQTSLWYHCPSALTCLVEHDPILAFTETTITNTACCIACADQRCPVTQLRRYGGALRGVSNSTWPAESRDVPCPPIRKRKPGLDNQDDLRQQPSPAVGERGGGGGRRGRPFSCPAHIVQLHRPATTTPVSSLWACSASRRQCFDRPQAGCHPLLASRRRRRIIPVPRHYLYSAYLIFFVLIIPFISSHYPLSRSLQVVTQIRGHIAGPLPPSPQKVQYVPSVLSLEDFSIFFPRRLVSNH